MQITATRCTDDGIDAAAIVQLQPGRAHEFCGAARRMLAVWALAGLGPHALHLWLRPRWSADRLNPSGLGDWLNPASLILLDAARDSDMLACAEEALRAGAVASVTLEMRAPPALTPLRRLHLAAEAGLARRRTQVRSAGLVALVLTPGDGGTPGVESRWQLTPCPAPDVPCLPGSDTVRPFWQLRRLRARMAPPAAWQIETRGQGQIHAHPIPDHTAG